MPGSLELVLEKRGRRTIAALLAFKEREVDAYLPTATSTALRKEILDAVNELCALGKDLLGSGCHNPGCSGIIYNQMYLDRMYELVRGAVTPDA